MLTKRSFIKIFLDETNKFENLQIEEIKKEMESVFKINKSTLKPKLATYTLNLITETKLELFDTINSII